MTGFNSKREAAADKLQELPSEWAGIKAILDEYGLQAIDFVADFKAALAQPVQEPVREALKLALVALEESQTDNDTMEFWDRKSKAITAIKEALAQPAQYPEREALMRIAAGLRLAGARLPAAEPTGTIQGSFVSGLCVALAIVESEIEAQPAQEPVAFDAFLESEDFYELMQAYRHFPIDALVQFEAVKDALRTAHNVKERNFCPRCGKRTNNIHTCTPPQGAA